VVVVTGAAFGCGEAAAPALPSGPVEPAPTLRELAQARTVPFGVGTAVGSLFKASDAIGKSYDSVLAKEFNVVTAENDMKFQSIRPTRGEFQYARADAMLAFAKANGMVMRGHTLVWHSQLAPWLTGGVWTTQEVRDLLDEHITNVVGHYKGRLVAWDVVNEAFNDGTASLRSGFWADRLGREYIEQAFRTAHAADPDVALYYNDYNTEAINAKSDSVFALLGDLIARGVPVHGVGFQMHLIAGQLPSMASMEANFDRFAGLGLRIHITEMDIRVPVPASLQSLQTQAADYRAVFDLCLRKPACEMIVMWGFTDRASWVPGTFPGQGDALLFNAAFQPKAAYWAVHDRLSH
jgi:endo-1,4-beta-xylanase